MCPASYTRRNVKPSCDRDRPADLPLPAGVHSFCSAELKPLVPDHFNLSAQASLPR